MAKVNKISSFKSFTEIRKQESASKLREENNLKRQESVGKIAAILDELGLTSFEGLEEDQKESIISKIFGDVSEEEIAEIEVEVEEVTEKEGVKHYTEDGKEWTGPTHKMPDGTLMTQNPHNEDSEKLFHKEDLKESTINEASDEDKPYFDFLVALRDSGATNMFGAAPYLQNEFGMSKGEARKILTKWMKSFSESVVTEKAKFEVGDTAENSIGSEVEIIAIGNWRKISKQFKKEMGSDASSFGYEDTAKGDYYLARIVKSEEGDEGDLGIFPVEYDHANYWGLGESLMNEALDIKYKRDAKKVLTQYNKIFAELGSLTADKISHLGAIKYIYAEALTDANFHRERTATEKIIKGRLGSVTVNPLTLGKKAIIVGAKKISQILDEYYSRISNAAGWSGIGVAEGTALYLESIGESKLAEKLLAGFNAVEESVKFQLTEEEISLKESKFNEVVNHIINEGTRGQFGKIDKKGNITSVYTHYDSYPENVLPIIKATFKAGKNVDFVLKNGDSSGLDKDLKKINFYGGDSNPMKGSIKNIDKYIKDANYEGGAEFVYLWDEGSKKWMMADIYKETGLIPAFESKIYEGLTTSLDEFTTDTKSYSGAIAYSFKNHKKNFKENIKVSTALGDKFKITNEKGGIVMQRSHGSEFDTVWLSADKKEAQKVADWLKSEGAEIVLFGPKTRSFTGSKQEFIDRYL